MPELTTWILVIVLSGGMFGGKGIHHIDGFTEVSCTEAAIRTKNQLTLQGGHAFCIAKTGRRL